MVQFDIDPQRIGAERHHRCHRRAGEIDRPEARIEPLDEVVLSCARRSRASQNAIVIPLLRPVAARGARRWRSGGLERCSAVGRCVPRGRRAGSPPGHRGRRRGRCRSRPGPRRWARTPPARARRPDRLARRDRAAGRAARQAEQRANRLAEQIAARPRLPPLARRQTDCRSPIAALRGDLVERAEARRASGRRTPGCRAAARRAARVRAHCPRGRNRRPASRSSERRIASTSAAKPSVLARTSITSSSKLSVHRRRAPSCGRLSRGSAAKGEVGSSGAASAIASSAGVAFQNSAGRQPSRRAASAHQRAAAPPKRVGSCLALQHLRQHRAHRRGRCHQPHRQHRLRPPRARSGRRLGRQAVPEQRGHLGQRSARRLPRVRPARTASPVRPRPAPGGRSSGAARSCTPATISALRRASGLAAAVMPAPPARSFQAGACSCARH